MKRGFMLAAALSCAAALVMGCSRDAGGDRAAQPVLGFSQIGAESEWRTANTASIKSSLAKAGIQLRFSDAQQKQENQIKALRSFIAQRVDLIAFSPVVESGWETVLREAKAAAEAAFRSAGDGSRTLETFEILHFAAWTPAA